MWVAGPCPPGESYILSSGGRTDISPWEALWLTSYSSQVRRECAPRCAHPLLPLPPTAPAPPTAHSRRQGALPCERVRLSCPPRKVAPRPDHLAASPHADCTGHTHNLTSALFAKCAREADPNVDDVLSSDEFSDFFLCLRVPRECHPDLCA